MDHESQHDGKSNTAAPPSYDAISTQASPFGVSIRQRSSSRTMFPRWGRKRTVVLARICDLVTAPDYTPSSVTSTVNDCAASLSVSEFSKLLQSPDIRGHTAMYWAILNDRREALFAIIGFIQFSELSSASRDDLRLACIAASDHALYTQLGLGRDIDGEYMAGTLMRALIKLTCTNQPTDSLRIPPQVYGHISIMKLLCMREIQWTRTILLSHSGLSRARDACALSRTSVQNSSPRVCNPFFLACSPYSHDDTDHHRTSMVVAHLLLEA